MTSNKPCHFDIRIHHVCILLVLFGQWEQGSSDLEEIGNVGEVQSDEGPPVSEQVIWKTQVFFIKTFEALDQPFKSPSAPFLNFHLMAFLDRNQEVRIVFNRGLEASSVVLKEIVVDASATTRYVWILYCGAVHINEPAGPGLPRFKTGETQGLINAVGQPNGLEFLILRGRFARTK